MIDVISEEDLDKLFKESRQIVEDCQSYLQFRHQRESVLRRFIPVDGLN